MAHMMVCIVDRDGGVVREVTVRNTPKAVMAFHDSARVAIKRIGRDACSLSELILESFAEGRCPVDCLVRCSILPRILGWFLGSGLSNGRTSKTHSPTRCQESSRSRCGSKFEVTMEGHRSRTRLSEVPGQRLVTRRRSRPRRRQRLLGTRFRTW